LDDIRALAAPALRHRVILNFAGESEGIDPDTLIAQVLDAVQTQSTRTAEPVVG
jgi:MoxR-like ATPase